MSSFSRNVPESRATRPMKQPSEKQLLAALLSRFSSDIHFDGRGFVSMRGPDAIPVASQRILKSIDAENDVDPRDDGAVYIALRDFMKFASSEDRAAVDLGLEIPSGIHFVHAGDGLFYDFRNTDRTLSELLRAGAQIRGSVLDFGCSSGRNLATLRRAAFPDLELHGVDPVPSSIRWARENIPDVAFEISGQHPPLPYADDTFDLIFAKSIWTHFSTDAARKWMIEIARVLRTGGHFFVTTHGPHDVANRLIFNFPRPNYLNIADGKFMNKVSFLSAVIGGLRERGFFFAPYSRVENQGDLGKIRGASTQDWGMMFMTASYLQEEIIPEDLELVQYTAAATAGRLDGSVLRKVGRA